MAVHTVQTEPLKEILNELFSLLETLETNNAAILQFLREEGIASEEKLAPYFERAGRASNVKWLAARRRMEYLLTPIQKEESDGDKGKEQARGAGAQKESGSKEKGGDGGDKANPDGAQALAGKPVQTPAGSKADSAGQTDGETPAGGEKPDAANAAKAGSASQEQGNNKPQKQQTKQA